MHFSGTPGGTRTPDLLLRRQLLYPAELLAYIFSCHSEERSDEESAAATHEIFRSAQDDTVLSEQCGGSSDVAGLAGFEPTHTRVKVWCLTTWRQPSICARRRPRQRFRIGSAPFRPVAERKGISGVSDGTRTHGLQSHNLTR